MSEEKRTEISIASVEEAETYEEYIQLLQSRGVDTHKSFHMERVPGDDVFCVVVQKLDG